MKKSCSLVNCSPPNTELQFFPDQDLYYYYTPVIAGVKFNKINYSAICIPFKLVFSKSVP